MRKEELKLVEQVFDSQVTVLLPPRDSNTSSPASVALVQYFPDSPKLLDSEQEVSTVNTDIY